ncbi:MAG: OpgC domain-containing protein [Deltaproteobacteria bacterium]|nr:OpgC domain-containing protein [Deltaproteobacteria bacterium]
MPRGWPPPRTHPDLATTAGRDARLDVWRGLCLVDVVLVHLAYNQLGFPEPLDSLIKHYTRFAAGGFVFLAGLTIATVFVPRYARSAADRWAVCRWLWRRAALLVLVDLGASAAFRALDAVRSFPASADGSIADVLREVLLLQRPGVTGGILTLYALLLAAMPAVLALYRRTGGWPLAAASLGLYGVALAAAPLLHWPAHSFPVAYWQPLFIAGFLWRDALAWLDRGARIRRVAWIAAAAVAFAAIALAQYGPALGFDHLAHVLPLSFDKTPLQPGQLLWYLAIVQLLLATWLLPWMSLPGGAAAATWLALLGRHSLLVYTAHVFTEAVVLEHVWSVWPPIAVRLGLVVADLAALGLLCKLVDDGALARHARGAVRGAVEALLVPRGALIATTAVLLTVGVAALLPLRPTDDNAAAVHEQLIEGTVDEASTESNDAAPVVDDALFEPGRDQIPLLGDDERGPSDELEIYDEEPVAHET